MLRAITALGTKTRSLLFLAPSTLLKSPPRGTRFYANDLFDNPDAPTGPTRTRGLSRFRVISTLNPLWLDRSDFLDVSCSSHPSIAILSQPSWKNSPRQTCPRFRIAFHYERRGGLLKEMPFPKDTSGYLYYHAPAKLPATAGEIRFRITESNSPSSFFSGKDLLSHRGVPWRIPLLTIASHSFSCYQPIREQLLLERLVTEQQLVTCARIFSSHALRTHCITLHSLDQLFPITFGSSVVLWLVAQGEARYVRIQKLFHDVRVHPTQSPYTGSALARFERSTLAKHADTRTLVMRIVKIIEPVTHTIPDYDGFVPEPTEGGLLPQGVKSKVWSCNVDCDKPSAWALSHLVPGDHAPQA